MEAQICPSDRARKEHVHGDTCCEDEGAAAERAWQSALRNARNLQSASSSTAAVNDCASWQRMWPQPCPRRTVVDDPQGMRPESGFRSPVVGALASERGQSDSRHNAQSEFQQDVSSQGLGLDESLELQASNTWARNQRIGPKNRSAQRSFSRACSESE